MTTDREADEAPRVVLTRRNGIEWVRRSEWEEAREQVAALTAEVERLRSSVPDPYRNGYEDGLRAAREERWTGRVPPRPSVPVSADREAGEYDYRQMWLEASEEVQRLRDAVAAVARLCEEGLRTCACDGCACNRQHAARYSAIRAALPALPPQEERCPYPGGCDLPWSTHDHYSEGPGKPFVVRMFDALPPQKVDE